MSERLKFPYSFETPMISLNTRKELNDALNRLEGEKRPSAFSKIAKKSVVGEGDVDELWGEASPEQEALYQKFRRHRSSSRSRNYDLKKGWWQDYSVPPHGAIRKFLPKILAILNSEEKGVDAFEKAVLLHHLVVWLKPYPDGNRRLGLALAELKMARSGLPVVRFGFDKAKYRTALQKAGCGSPRELGELFAKAIIAKAR